MRSEAKVCGGKSKGEGRCEDGRGRGGGGGGKIVSAVPALIEGKRKGKGEEKGIGGCGI